MKKGFKDFFKNVLECILEDDFQQEYLLEIPEADIREFLICIHAWNERETKHRMCLGLQEKGDFLIAKVFVD